MRRAVAGDKAVYVKVITYPTAKDVLLRVFSRRMFQHRVAREWSCIGLQQRLGLPCPERVCFGEERRNGVLRAAVLVTEEVPSAMPLDARLRDGGTALENAGAYVASLHAAGFQHGDLNARNLLVAASGSGAPTFCNVDCGRGRRLPWRRRITADHVRDLAPVLLAFRILDGLPAMQAVAHAYAQRLCLAFDAPITRMIEAELVAIEPRELRRLRAEASHAHARDESPNRP